MGLEAEVALAPPRAARERAHDRAVHPDLEQIAACLHPEAVPRAGRRLDRPRPGQRVDGARAVARAPEAAGLRVDAARIDLDLVALGRRRAPVVRGIAAAERRDADEDAGVVLRARQAPVDEEHEVGEALAR